MKLNLLLFCSFMMLSTANAQVLPFADTASRYQKENTETIRVKPSEEKTLNVYPNPSTGVINMSLSGFSGKKTALSVVNVIGTVVFRETVFNTDNAYTKSIDMRRQAPGLYYVKLEAADYSEIRKVILK